MQIGRYALTASLVMLAAACSGGTEAASKDAQNAAASAADVKSPSPKAVDAAANPDAADTGKTTPPAASKESSVNELQSHIPSGSKLLDSKIGDLDGDGRSDALLVVDHPEAGRESKGGRARTVLVLVRDAGGRLQESAYNDKIVPCAKCGGLLGDPFGYARIDKNGFTVLIEGGSRQRWSSEYVFVYSIQSKDWLLQRVERGAYDQISEENVSRTFTPEDFGQIAFSDFDPATIPEVVLP